MRTNRIRARSEHLSAAPSAVFASEPMDDDPRWDLIAPGELVHVDAALQITRDMVLPTRPATSCAATT
ncbi:glutamine amidotransferase domain protein [Mycobacterium xenopi 4042]|uniref:Glutamine amidotransferase domain protein n=1 Tax=Mycobacterium xenopi 4042 TaxID=1299334 RepID=X8AFE6_MYCXE|nr:glutamine amidotransferase domain protein [Mycobacterium xenopi 4042]